MVNGTTELSDQPHRVVQVIYCQPPIDDRIESWKKEILSGTFCNVTAIDKNINYNEGLWRPRHPKYDSGNRGSIENTDACRFIRAAWRHREYVLHELLPDIELLVC